MFDLIKYNEEKFRIAFYYGLKDTLVCDNVDQATSINKQCDQENKRRFRIVTLRGELIEVQGTISGGGKPKQGGMSAQKKTDYTQSDVTQLEKEL